MGAYNDITGRKGGKGGGGSGRVAQEDPNTLRSNSVARIIDLLGEGPIEGLVDGAKSIFFDETPLQADDGSWNVSGVNYTTRAGLPDQDHIAGFPSVENETEVSAPVTHATPLIRTINDADVDAVRVTLQIPALTEQDKETGDLHGSRVQIAIDVRPSGGSWSQRKTDTIKGKTTSPYQRGYRIELEGAAPWDIRVRRLSADNDDDSAIRNETYWSSFTEIIDGKFIYPDSALVALEVDAQQFGNSIPSRAYHVRGRLVSVPDNYDPETRAYTGIWSGAFKQAWTDNPAWIYYDLATNVRFGAGLTNVDKWALYEIGRYCDALVPNGYGDDEPRFTINTVISSREEAYKVLTTLASAFRGMMYWGTGTVTVVQDAPQAGSGGRIFGPADTVDGQFKYSGSSLKSRHTVALVTWNDPSDNYRQSIEVVEDPAGIKQYGWRQTDVTAFGCTSRGQARRVGLWLLYTEREETETVEFTVGLDHADIRPGEIVKINDPHKAGARLAGRLRVAGTDSLTLDKRPDVASGTGWQVAVQMPNGSVETRDVAGFSGDQIDLATPLSTTPTAHAMWMLSSADIQPRRFRVLGVAEDTDTLEYTVTGLEHNPNKFALIEQGLVLPEAPTSLIPTGRLTPPLDISVESFTYLSGGASHQGLLISWVKSSDPRTQYYIVNILPPGEQAWQDVGATDQTSIEYRNAPSGEYQVRVRGVDGAGRLSAWSVRVTTISSLLQPLPPETVDVETANYSVTLIPRSDRQGQLYEYRRAMTPLEGDGEIETNAVDLGQATQLADTNLKSGTQYYYWVRGVNAYGVSSWYPVQAKTREDFAQEWGYVDEQLRRPGGLVDQLENGINDNAEQLAVARQQFDDRVDDANSRIDEADARADELSARADDALANAQSALDNATAALDQGALNGQDIESVRSNLDAAQSTIDALRLDVNAIQTDGATIDYVERITQQLEQMSALRYTALRAISSGNAATIDVVQNVMATDNAAMTQRIEQQSSRIDDAEGRITDVDTTYADQYGALSSRIGELSAKIDSAPTFGSGFEPGADLEQWNVPSSNTLAAQTTDVYAGVQSALVTSSRTAPSATQVPNAQIPSGATAAFAGYEVVVRIAARRPASGASSEFAVRYTGGSQNSGWQRFTPTEVWALYEFRYDVAEGARSNDRIAVWADTSGAGGGVLIDAVSVRRADAAITEITALIEREQQVRAQEDEANASDTRTLKSSFEGAQSRNEQRFETLTRDGEALAQRTGDLESTVGDHASQIQTLERTSAGRDNAETIRYLAQSAKTALAATSIEVLDIQRINDREALAQRIVTVNAELAGNIAGLRDQYTALSTRTTAIAQRVETTESQIGENAADITETRTTIADGERFQAIVALAQRAKTALGAVSIEVEQQVRQTEDESLAQITTKLRADLNSASSSIDQRLTALVTGQQSLAQTVTDIQTDYGDAISSIQNSLTSLSDETGSIAQDLRQIDTRFGDSTAALESDVRALSDADQSLGERIDSTRTEFRDRSSSIESTVSSLSDDQQSIAQRQERFEAEAGDQFAAVEDSVSALTGPAGIIASSIRTVNVNGKKAMIGMTVNGEVAEIVMAGDRIAYYTGSGELRLTALFEDGRAVIRNARIRDLTADNIDVKSLSAALVDAGEIRVGFDQVDGLGSVAKQNSIELDDLNGGTLEKGRLSDSVTLDGGDKGTVGELRERAFAGLKAGEIVDIWKMVQGGKTVINPEYFATDIAFINRGMVKNAVIGTLQLENEAVFIPRKTYDRSAIRLGSDWQNVLQLDIDDLDYDTDFSITVSYRVDTSGFSGAYQMNCFVGGDNLARITNGRSWESGQRFESFSVGRRTFGGERLTVAMKRDSNVSGVIEISYRGIIINGVKYT
ncbi:TipJ family phage tail tip protein [Salinicola sp. V024]|uniref:TipJ family phage tail tip protein n=1 Tax=Salinicola sp. V024 TaxID=3459609 RepID=UPI004043B57B